MDAMHIYIYIYMQAIGNQIKNKNEFRGRIIYM
jgi:hypothetical protein